MPALWETEFTKTFHHSTYPAIAPTRPELSAAGKTVLITGGGRGIGPGIVKAFAEAGASHIVITGRGAESLEAVAARTNAAYPSTQVATVAGDVTVEEDVARMFAKAKSVGGDGHGVDVVIANAGYLAEVAAVGAATGASAQEKAATADWWRAFEVNVKGVYLLARYFLGARSGPGAVFANISAPAAHVNPALPGFSHYAGSKLGAARVVETLQRENDESEGRGLRFYNVHPGAIRTDMLTKSRLSTAAVPVDDDDLPGHFLVWVASPEAAFLKGKFVWCNWDVDELKARKDELEDPRKLVTGLVGWGA